MTTRLGNPDCGDYVRVLKSGQYQGVTGYVVERNPSAIPSQIGVSVCVVLLDNGGGRIAVHGFHLEVIARAV